MSAVIIATGLVGCVVVLAVLIGVALSVRREDRHRSSHNIAPSRCAGVTRWLVGWHVHGRPTPRSREDARRNGGGGAS